MKKLILTLAFLAPIIAQAQAPTSKARVFRAKVENDRTYISTDSAAALIKMFTDSNAAIRIRLALLQARVDTLVKPYQLQAAIAQNPGPKGDKGDPGSPGITPVLKVGTVTTGAPGSAAAAAFSASESTYNLNLTIPAGSTGPAGIQGNTGPAATIAFGTVTTGNPGTAASAEFLPTGPGAYTLNLTIPRGSTGATGSQGTPGVFTPVHSFVTRPLNTAFTVSATKAAFVFYTVSMSATNPILAGSSVSDAIFEYSTNGGSTWTTFVPLKNQASVSLAVAFGIGDLKQMEIVGILPPGAVGRIRSATTGTAAVNSIAGVEVTF